MVQLSRLKLFLAAGGLAMILGAAPATPSYHGVERAIDDIRKSWAQPGARPQPNAAGWNAFFDALRGELANCTRATNENERLVSLNRLHKMWVAIEVTPWRSGQALRDDLRAWLRPRVMLAWAERRLVEKIRSLTAPASPSTQQNRNRWIRFVDDDLGRALREYDAATTVTQRLEALDRVYGALNSLKRNNASTRWSPSVTLEMALNDLYNRPNLDVSADAATLAPVLSADIVRNEVIYRKGYASQVTPGPKTGFGLLPSDNGIAFYNSQMMTSVTPITDFQQQIASDRRGRRAAKLYNFGATSTNNAQLTVVAVLTPSGLQLGPQYQHNIDALITSIPQPGRNLVRGIAALVGFNQARITNEVYSNAIPRIRDNVVQEAAELGAERTGQEAAGRNVTYSQYLIGYNRLAFQNLLIERLSLRSRPENALIGGTLQWRNGRDQVGADLPQPSWLAVPAPGVSADLHLGSILTSMARGYFETEAVKRIQNLMLVTRKADPNVPPRERFNMVENADYATFLGAVTEAQAANDPKVLAVRVKRPGRAPEFAADARGFFVASVPDFQVDVPVPPQQAQGGLIGGPARVLRVTSPRAEVVISVRVKPGDASNPVRVEGKVEEFDPGPDAMAYRINEDESQAQPLTRFAGLGVVAVLRTRIQGQSFNVPLNNLQLRGFALRDVSPIDPTGWVRVNLVRTSATATAGLPAGSRSR